MKQSTFPSFALSFIAATTFIFCMLSISTLGPAWLAEDGIIEAFLGLLLFIIFWPFIIIILLLGIAATILTVTGTAFIAAGKHKAGGILVIVGSALGCFLALPVFLIPTIVGLIGGVLAVAHEKEQL